MIAFVADYVQRSTHTDNSADIFYGADIFYVIDV